MKTIDRRAEGEPDEDDLTAGRAAPEMTASGAPGDTAAPSDASAATSAGDEGVPRHPNFGTRMQSMRRAKGVGAASRGPGHLKVDVLLSEPDRKAYEELLKDPHTTHGIAQRWLQAHGYEVGAYSVRNHRNKFRESLRDLRQAAEMAHAFASLAREQGIGVMTDATMVCAEQLLMQQMMHIVQARSEQAAFTPKQWSDLNKAIGEGIANRRQAEQMRQELERAKQEAARAVEEVTRDKPDGKAVADRVREILGIPLGEGE